MVGLLGESSRSSPRVATRGLRRCTSPVVAGQPPAQPATSAPPAPLANLASCVVPATAVPPSWEALRTWRGWRRFLQRPRDRVRNVVSQAYRWPPVGLQPACVQGLRITDHPAEDFMKSHRFLLLLPVALSLLLANRPSVPAQEQGQTVEPPREII